MVEFAEMSDPLLVGGAFIGLLYLCWVVAMLIAHPNH